MRLKNLPDIGLCVEGVNHVGGYWWVPSCYRRLLRRLYALDLGQHGVNVKRFAFAQGMAILTLPRFGRAAGGIEKSRRLKAWRIKTIGNP